MEIFPLLNTDNICFEKFILVAKFGKEFSIEYLKYKKPESSFELEFGTYALGDTVPIS